MLCMWCREPLRFTSQGWVDSDGQHVRVVNGRDDHIHLPDRGESEPHVCLGVNPCRSCKDIECGATFGPFVCSLEIGHDGACVDAGGQRFSTSPQQTRDAILALLSDLGTEEVA